MLWEDRIYCVILDLRLPHSGPRQTIGREEKIQPTKQKA